MDWLVIGWYTPDYGEPANKFAENLLKYKIAFRLYPVPKQKEWGTQRKPEIVLKAMKDYPQSTLILMDVDCIIRGPLEGIQNFIGDVSINISGTDISNKGKIWRRPIQIVASSRVIGFKPTREARKFVNRWKEFCSSSHYSGDETALAWAYLASPGAQFSYINPIYSGTELFKTTPDDILVVHSSARNKFLLNGSIKEWFKGIERKYLRSGKSKKLKKPLYKIAIE